MDKYFDDPELDVPVQESDISDEEWDDVVKKFIASANDEQSED